MEKKKDTGVATCSSFVRVYTVEAVTSVSRIRADNSKAGSLNGNRDEGQDRGQDSLRGFAAGLYRPGHKCSLLVYLP